MRSRGEQPDSEETVHAEILHAASLAVLAALVARDGAAAQNAAPDFSSAMRLGIHRTDGGGAGRSADRDLRSRAPLCA